MNPYVKQNGEPMTTVSVRLDAAELFALDEVVSDHLERKIRAIDPALPPAVRESMADRMTATRSEAIRWLIQQADGWGGDARPRRRSGPGRSF